MSRVRVAVIGLTLLIVTYLGSYFALLKPTPVISPSGRGGWTLHRELDYRVGGDAADAIFAPVAWLDQRVRPGYWAEPPDEFLREGPIIPEFRSPLSDSP